MSELTITLLRLGYLALLWVLVLSSIAVLRRDLYGTRITKRRARRQAPLPAGGPVAVGPATGPTPVASRQARGGQRSSRLVVTHGPHGQELSKPLARVHCGSLRWRSRALRSSATA